MKKKEVIENQGITLNEIKDTLRSSGYLIEQRVSGIFSAMDYFSIHSPTIRDQKTNIFREYDLESVKVLYNDQDLEFSIRFIIECENNKQPIVFFEDNVDMTLYTRHINTTFPSNITSPLLNLLSQAELSNYKFSSQYCSFHLKKDKSEWLASHHEEQHNTFRKLQEIIAYKVGSTFDMLNKKNKISIVYPMIVFQGEIFYLKKSQINDLNLEKTNHIIHKVLEFHSPLFVDVVNEKDLRNIIDFKEYEADLILKLINANKDAFMQNCEKSKIGYMSI